LFRRELIERQVPIEGVDHPIAVRPNLTIVIEVNAMRVGVAGVVEPKPSAMLAIAFRVEQQVDVPLVGLRRTVGDERFDLFG